ncbi:cold-shock protein [Paenibacillus sp. N3/727]|uniref:cold-shock protein n=1 Tax=Paenibacillus sp. N3/727 TaxID=2925845 RepID=UPI001F5319A9|nr:cold-shock protein [Paenibacillus sp. N3/727]UNK20902.1 cold-shock protein [Paenibacillus sp. N3/727]
MYFRKKSLEELPQEETAVWTCEKEGCNGWIRDDFAFEHQPTCHQCSSPMIRSIKTLPQLVNSKKDIKNLAKGTQIS